MLHVFKRSCNAHVMFIFGHFTVYAYRAYRTSDIFLQKKPLIFHFSTRNHFRDEIIRLVMNTRLFTTLKNVDMFKIIEFYRFMHSTFCSWKCFEIFIRRSLEDGFVGGVWFSKWRLVQNVAKCKYLFPSILPQQRNVKNWYYARSSATKQWKGCTTIVEKYLVVSVKSQFEFQN